MAKLRSVIVLAGLLATTSATAQEIDEDNGIEELTDAEVGDGTEAEVEDVPDVAEDAQPPPADVASSIRAPEQPRGLARAELVTFQTAFGIGLGAEVCVLAECSDVRAWIGSLMLGASAGFGLSFWLSNDGVTHGQAASVNSGVIWGTVAGAFLAGTLEPDSEKAFMGTMIGVQLVGLAVGATFAALVRPPSGDVALTDMIALWTVAITAMSFGAAEFDGETKVIFGSLFGATAVGLAIGSQMYRWTPMSRGRAMIINAGGIVGLLLGMGVAVLIAGDDVEAGALFGAAIPGTLVGLGLTWWLTRNFDVPETNAEIGFAPTPDGGAFAFVRGSF
jgi:hypothetical protein